VPRKSSKETAEAEVTAAHRAIIELFSDPKMHVPARRRFYYDPERQEFIQDPLDLAVEEAIKGGKPRWPRRIRIG
jgi:hypothetical protein